MIVASRRRLIEQSLSDINHARTAAAAFIASYGSSPELDAWLQQLDAERAEQLVALRLEVGRPMLKATLRAAALRKAGTR